LPRSSSARWTRAPSTIWRRWVDGELVRKFERNADGSIHWDSQALLKVMIDNWREVFAKTLGHAERALVGELIEVRNRWAHQRPFSYDDTHRALDSAQRLLSAISAGDQAAEIDKMRQEMLRTMFAEQARQQTRRPSRSRSRARRRPGSSPGARS
jgi:Swt1-like HEPN